MVRFPVRCVHGSMTGTTLKEEGMLPFFRARIHKLEKFVDTGAHEQAGPRKG